MVTRTIDPNHRRLGPDGATRARRPTSGVLACALLATIAIATQLAGQVAADAARRPNVVVILTDDQRYDTLWSMPNVRSMLMDRGVYFPNAFVPNALCCPSRVSILTGLHSHTNGVYWNGPPRGGFAAFDDRASIATVLDDAGYRTGFVGKYLNGYVGASYDNYGYVPPGWDRWFAVPTGSYYDYQAASDGAKTGIYGTDPGDYSARVMTRVARSFVETASGDPFFLFYSAAAPHSSPRPTEEGKAAVPGPMDVDTMSLLPTWRPSSYGTWDDVSDMPQYIQRHGWGSKTGERVDLLRQRQLESLASLDRQIGRLLEALPANTLVIFLSDNGYLWGEHRWTSKQVPYEESIRIPLIVTWPGRVPQGVDSRLALNIDVVPTILAAVGSSPGTPTGVDAASGLPVAPEGLDLLGEERRPAFVLEHGTQKHGSGAVPGYCGVRTAGWMWVRYSDAGSDDDGFVEMYDVVSDPLQQHNLADVAAFAPERRGLRALAKDLCAPTPPGFSWSVPR